MAGRLRCFVAVATRGSVKTAYPGQGGLCHWPANLVTRRTCMWVATMGFCQLLKPARLGHYVGLLNGIAGILAPHPSCLCIALIAPAVRCTVLQP